MMISYVMYIFVSLFFSVFLLFVYCSFHSDVVMVTVMVMMMVWKKWGDVKKKRKTENTKSVGRIDGGFSK